MLSIFSAFFGAVVVAAIATPLVRRAALHVGAVDEPAARRVHTRRIPRLGGVAIVAGFFVPLLGLYAFNTPSARELFGHTRLVAGLIAGSLVMASLGVADDVGGVGAKRKLGVQVAASLIAWAAGLRIKTVILPLVGTLDFGPLSALFTVIWFVAIMNALNLIDGLDGLAAGVAFFACVTNFVTAWLMHSPSSEITSLLVATLGGSIVGFLMYNFHPATIFMGDTGSLFLGFILAAVPLFGPGTHKGGTALAILVPLLALGLPIMDMLLAIVRRFLERRSIFAPDRGHIHHRLLDLGLTHRRAVLILYGASLLFTFVAVITYVGRRLEIGLAMAALSFIVFVAVRAVGPVNFALRRRENQRVRDPMVEALVTCVPRFVVRVEFARGPEDLPVLIERFRRDAGLAQAALEPGEGSRLPKVDARDPTLTEAQFRDFVGVRLEYADAEGATFAVRFQWDCADGEVHPQADVLLRVAGDAIHRVATNVRARTASMIGSLPS